MLLVSVIHARMEFSCVVTDKQYSEAIFMAKKMPKIWHKVQENGTKNIRLAKVVAKEKKILAQTLPVGWVLFSALPYGSHSMKHFA